MYLFNKILAFEASLILIMIILFCMSCNQEHITEEQEKDGLCLFKIEYPLGTAFDPFENQIVEYLPCPLSKVIVPHITTQDSVLFYALSNYVSEGKKILAAPFGVLKLRDGEKIYEIILLQAEDNVLRVMEVESFDTWITQNYAAALMIQDWFTNVGNNNMLTFVSWENEFYARRLMKRIGI